MQRIDSSACQFNCFLQKDHIDALVLGTKGRVHDNGIDTPLESVQSSRLEVGEDDIQVDFKGVCVTARNLDRVGIDVKADGIPKQVALAKKRASLFRSLVPCSKNVGSYAENATAAAKVGDGLVFNVVIDCVGRVEHACGQVRRGGVLLILNLGIIYAMSVGRSRKEDKYKREREKEAYQRRRSLAVSFRVP